MHLLFLTKLLGWLLYVFPSSQSSHSLVYQWIRVSHIHLFLFFYLLFLCTKCTFPYLPKKCRHQQCVYEVNCYHFLYNVSRTFSWSGPSSWGQGCGSGIQQYVLYINSGTTIALTRTITYPAVSTNITFSTAGTYSWKMRAYNGLTCK